MSYHITKIEPGVYGEASKIREEFEEFMDASETQGCKVMELVELSDMIGAIEAYVKLKYNMNLNDLIQMSNVTKRAFNSGHRKPKSIDTNQKSG